MGLSGLVCSCRPGGWCWPHLVATPAIGGCCVAAGWGAGVGLVALGGGVRDLGTPLVMPVIRWLPMFESCHLAAGCLSWLVCSYRLGEGLVLAAFNGCSCYSWLLCCCRLGGVAGVDWVALGGGCGGWGLSKSTKVEVVVVGAADIVGVAWGMGWVLGVWDI
ncbi:hypothetical protein U1Q18_001666 [Sarracenia purpurea var. burkii]